MMSWVSTDWLGLLVAGALTSGFLAVTSCGRTDNGGGDSNTHWLEVCETDAECGALDCLCGVCSRRCDAASDCRGFGSRASCEIADGCADGVAAVCVESSSPSAGGSGTTVPSVPPDPCAALDARSSGDDCDSIIGYTWNGKICERVMCSCQGTACDAVYEAAEECDWAYQACYAQSGLIRECETHADCRLRPRTCCSQCGSLEQADMMIAENITSADARGSGACLGDPEGVCNACDPIQNPSIYAACVFGQCSVMSLYDWAGCATDDQCRISTKDCCDCGGDVSASGVIAVNPTFTHHTYCGSPSCDGCVPELQGATAICNPDLGLCEVASARGP
jgi:hypothetical protein